MLTLWFTEKTDAVSFFPCANTPRTITGVPHRQSCINRTSIYMDSGDTCGRHGGIGGHGKWEGNHSILTHPPRYNTVSNKVRIIKTPGGELRYLHLKKKGTAPKCGDCGMKLAGVSFTPPIYTYQLNYNPHIDKRPTDGLCRSPPFVPANTAPSPAQRRPSSARMEVPAAPTASRTVLCVRS
jgi:ribosomal protein L34E